jgi:hypothetical protein
MLSSSDGECNDVMCATGGAAVMVKKQKFYPPNNIIRYMTEFNV